MVPQRISRRHRLVTHESLNPGYDETDPFRNCYCCDLRHHDQLTPPEWENPDGVQFEWRISEWRISEQRISLCAKAPDRAQRRTSSGPAGGCPA